MEKNIPPRPGEKIFIWFLLLFSTLTLIYSFTLPHENLSSPGTFPVLIGAVLIVSALSVLWKNRKLYREDTLKKQIAKIGEFALPRQVVIFTIILILYIVLIGPLHFIFSSYLFLTGSFILLKGTGPIRALLLAAAVLGGIYLVFQYVFKVILW